MGRAKKERGERRLGELMRLADVAGYRIHMFSPVHVRVFGETPVDYWPTTAKAWRVGSSAAMARVEPPEVIAMAKVAHVVDQAAATSHMQSISQEDGHPPWE